MANQSAHSCGSYYSLIVIFPLFKFILQLKSNLFNTYGPIQREKYNIIKRSLIEVFFCVIYFHMHERS